MVKTFLCTQMTVVELIILQNFVHLGDVQISTELQIICRSRGAIRVLAFKLERNNFDFILWKKKSSPYVAFATIWCVSKKGIAYWRRPQAQNLMDPSLPLSCFCLHGKRSFYLYNLKDNFWPTILYRKASVFTKREERRGTCKLYKAMALFSKIKNFKFRPNSERLVHACKESIGICDLMCISADWKRPGNKLNILKQC